MGTPSPPKVTSVICVTPIPNAALQLSWEPTGDYTGPYTIVVQDNLGNSYGAAAGGTFGGQWAVSPSTPMNAAGSYVVIVKTSDPNVSTDKLPILVTPFQTVSTTFDGTTVGVAWTNPTGPAPTQAQIRLRATATRQDFPSILNVGAGTAIPNPAILPVAQGWYALVAPVTGIATGPWSAPPALILRSRPGISSAFARTANGRITITLLSARLDGYTDAQQFVVQLYIDDTAYLPPATIPSTKQPDGTCRIDYTLPPNTWPPPGGFVYRLGLRQANAAALGPEGLRQQFPSAAPYLEGVTYSVGATEDSISVTLESPAGIPLASGAFAALTDSGGQVKASGTWSRFAGSFNVAKGAAAGCSINAATLVGVARGLVSNDSVPVLSAQPVLSAVGYDGATVTASWSAVAGASGYLMAVLSQSQQLTGGNFGGTTGALSVPPGDLSVTVAALAARSQGPLAAPAGVIVNAPTISGLVFNTDGTATVTFANVPSNQALSYEVLDGDRSVSSDTLAVGKVAALLAADVLGPARGLSIRGRLVLRTATLTSNGPWSSAAPLVAKPPANVTVGFNGQIASVSWQRSASPLVTGYLVTILNSNQPALPPSATADTSVSIDCSNLAASGPYTVVVEPKAGPWAGKAAAPVMLFESGLYLSATAGISANVFPAMALDMASFDIRLYLPDLFAVKPTDPLPTGPVFNLAEAAAGDAPFAYILTIPKGPGGAWDFAQETIRLTVNQAYQALLTWLDNHQATGVGVHLVAESIGRAMPQTFAETLLYGCGMNAAQGFADLRPGHILKVEYEAYDYQGTTGPYAKYLNGFVGTNVSTYEVGSTLDANGRWLLGFDSFLSSISQYMSVPSPEQSQPPNGQRQGGGGGADLFFDGFRQPYCRVVYPGAFLAQNDSGSPYPYRNIALVAAGSLGDLADATANFRQKSTNIGKAAVLYFRGRTLITVCQRVWVDGAPLVVPFGRTVGNVLEALGRRPPDMSLPLAGLQLMRAAGPIVNDKGVAVNGFAVNGSVPVRLDWNTAGVRNVPHQWLDLPLLPGDMLTSGGG